MRYSYYKKLIGEEQRRRGAHYGPQARTRQLTILTLLLMGLYAVCTFNIWRNPRPVHHVWIDGVLVEVIEENWIDHARGGLFYVGLGCAALLGLLRLFTTVPTSDKERALNTAAWSALPKPHSTKEGRGMAASRYAPTDISTIAVPSWARRRGAEKEPPNVASMEGLQRSGTAAAAAAMDQTRAFDARRPMRSDADLNLFLAYENAQAQQQQQQLRFSPRDSAALRYRGGAESGRYPSDVDAAGRDVLSVRYDVRGTQRDHRGQPTAAADAATTKAYAYGAAAPLITLPWGELGIAHLEEALQRTREWISDVCRKLVDDVDQCDRWFNEHQCEAFDCHHSLHELLPAPAPTAMAAPQARPGGWWGGAAATAPAAAPAAPQVETKLTALLREKARCRQSQQGMQELDTALRYDQRLALEARLDITGTFPSSSLAPPSNAELTATREYVVERLRTFAKQRLLVSYNPSGGDGETWRTGYPCDAHLLLHVLRLSVKGLSAYVAFGYQAGTQSQELALYVGDTGEPYFYIRFRQGGSERLLSTRQGPTSLMEAILAFAAVIHTYYRDVFGGLRGAVDLAENGLLKVVTESRRAPWSGGFEGEW